jgi:hypothetical protein
MKRKDLEQVVVNVLERGGMHRDGALNTVAQNLPEAAKLAAAIAFTRNLTEDDDTRQLRWQYGDLYDNGTFTLEE